MTYSVSVTLLLVLLTAQTFAMPGGGFGGGFGGMGMGGPPGGMDLMHRRYNQCVPPTTTTTGTTTSNTPDAGRFYGRACDALFFSYGALSGSIPNPATQMSNNLMPDPTTMQAQILASDTQTCRTFKSWATGIINATATAGTIGGPCCNIFCYCDDIAANPGGLSNLTTTCGGLAPRPQFPFPGMGNGFGNFTMPGGNFSAFSFPPMPTSNNGGFSGFGNNNGVYPGYGNNNPLPLPPMPNTIGFSGSGAAFDAWGRPVRANNINPQSASRVDAWGRVGVNPQQNQQPKPYNWNTGR